MAVPPLGCRLPLSPKPPLYLRTFFCLRVDSGLGPLFPGFPTLLFRFPSLFRFPPEPCLRCLVVVRYTMVAFLCFLLLPCGVFLNPFFFGSLFSRPPFIGLERFVFFLRTTISTPLWRSTRNGYSLRIYSPLFCEHQVFLREVLLRICTRGHSTFLPGFHFAKPFYQSPRSFPDLTSRKPEPLRKNLVATSISFGLFRFLFRLSPHPRSLHRLAP